MQAVRELKLSVPRKNLAYSVLQKTVNGRSFLV